MEKTAAPSLVAELIPLGGSSAESDRRRLTGTAAGIGVLFLIATLFGVGLSRPTNFENSGNDLLTANTTSALDGEEAYLPTDKAGSPEPDTDLGSHEPSVSDTAKSETVEQNSSTGKSNAPNPAEAYAARDSYCNIYAGTVTGNVTPEQAAQRAQANGAIVGAIGGAVLGAIFGGTGKHSGRSTALGASAGLLAGATIGSSNGQLAAGDIRKRYQEAYSTCMIQQNVNGAAQAGG